MTASEVTEAARALVAAFGSHDREAYFAAFAPSATFVFHNYERVLNSRDEYEALWDQWVEGGFRVLGCTSSNQAVTMLSPAVAVFTHDVRTQLADGTDVVTTAERETIVFQRADGRWLGVHEHLSVAPPEHDMVVAP